ncbi:MAG TPA: alpha/beta hydrolase [Gaiellaceae bacterium]|nr:alpha/beta hydrolase [Gaiellaceae bacterium]
MERRRQQATARDGRTLAFAEWGDPEGFPVFSLHGTPTSRLWRHPDEGRYADAGVRVITYDRPGYGGSDRHRGRRVVDCAADVEAIADHLGLDRFAVTGRSGGGPHSLAVAARLPERVVRAESVVGIAPFDAAGLDWFEGMDANNVRETSWALAGEEVAARELEREAAELLARIEAEASAVLGDDWELAPVDRAALARPELAGVIREAFGEAFRNGAWGWVDDDLAFVSGWGFDVAEIRVPTRIVYGAEDALVPAGHGEWLARHVPGAELVVERELGHFADPAAVVEQFRRLAQPA